MDILTALDEIGGNASAQELSEYLSKWERYSENPIPARTIRYRISLLQERGVLLPPYIETNERRIGLGEGILVFQESRGKSVALEELIQKIPIFYWYVPTHGRYDGYLIHIVHDIAKPKMVDNLCKTMKDSKLIDDYYFFDVVDYESKSVDFSRYSDDGQLLWNWDRWGKGIDDKIESDTNIPFNLENNQELVEWDIHDIRILRQLKLEPNTSIGELAQVAGVSRAQASEKVQKLRDFGVIRGHKRAFGLIGDFLWFSCFIEVEDRIGGVLSCFQELPFPGGILTESKNKYCLRFGFSTTDLKQFLEGFKFIRPYLKSYFFQFQLSDRRETHYQDVFQMFDEESNEWRIPIDDYISMIRRVK